MKIQRQRPGLLRVAMAVHPEYDDRYFRYIENFSASDPRGRALTVRREEDTVWRIKNAPQQTHIRYSLRLPAQRSAFRQSWKPFLTRDGGMVGDLHSLMYVVDEEKRRARLDLEMPAEWTAASGLEPTSNPRSFTGSTELLLDSPIMIGKLVDLRIVPLSFQSEGDFKVRIQNPESIWAKAGIRTGDTIISADEGKISTWQDFRGWLRRLKIGDTARLIISREGNTQTVEVPIKGFSRAVVRITELKDATAKQLMLRKSWLNAN
jgi:predicted metalloprotease with PDZ domain